MSAKNIAFAGNARDAIGSGLKILADAVKVTLGPRGRNVLIESRVAVGRPRFRMGGERPPPAAPPGLLRR